MLRNLKLFLIFLNISNIFTADNVCDFANCNHEGKCHLNNNEKICTCIGNKYFKGPKCSKVIDLCEAKKPCYNDGKCRAVIGQFICKDCNKGFGGLRCDQEVPNAFTNLLVYFNHYGLYAKPHKFLIMAETLGEVPFSLEFVSDNYAIDSWETKTFNGKSETKWTYTNDLESVIKKNKIRYYNDLPYRKGYYHLASETFWNYGLLELTLRSYDTETGTKLFHENIYDLLIVKGSPHCVPQLKFFHGANPVDPLMVDIARYNNFEANLKQRCFETSKIIYKWSVYNSIGTTKLYDFGITKVPLLKVPPYKLWFNYSGEVMSSYQILLKVEESYKMQAAVTQASCFILVLPKPIKAIIKGGSYRAIGIKQDLHIDGTASRDFALAPNVLQDMIYNWDCVSTDDPDNHNCREKIGSTSKLILNHGVFKINANYKFTLNIKSKVNQLVSDQTSQLVQIVEQSQLLLHVQCIRNCIRQQFIVENFIHLRVIPIKGTFSENVKYNWISEKEIISQEQRLIYTPKETDVNLKFEVVVQEDILQGKAIMEFTKNFPPQDGSCTINPLDGEAFRTEFHIKCLDYQDEDTPLNYQYFTGEFPLQRINDPEISLKLPETDKIMIKICDQFDACTEIELKVSVGAIKVNRDIQSFIRGHESRLSKLLEEGNVLSAMILMKSVVKYIKTDKDIWLMIKEIENYNLKTLMEIEQFLEITKELIFNILPLDYKKSYIFVKYFQKLNKGFEAVFKDTEIKDLMKSPYKILTNKFMDIMGEFSKSWESTTQIQLIKPQIIQVSNPLKENYDDLPDFDVLTLKRMLNWLQSARALHKCFDFMGMAAVELYYPLEKPLVIQDHDKFLMIFALEKSEKQELILKENSILLTLNEQVIQNLKQQLHSSSVLLQIASLDSNPFWWHPDDEPLDTEVFYITASSRKSATLKSQIKLKYPIQFQLKLKSPIESPLSDQIRGVLKNNLHMPLYYLEMNENSVLIVRFINIEKSLKIKVGFHRNPRSFEVKQKGLQVRPNKLDKKYVFVNRKGEKVKARLALLLDDDKAENVNFAFNTEIRECVYWDFELPDPQWSSKGCKPKLKINKSMPLGLKCECYHLSAFAAKTYKRPMQVDLGNRELLYHIPLNWSVILLYITLLIFFAIILLCNFLYYKNHKEYLISNSQEDNNDIEVRIYTGSHWNSGTSANITLKLISEKGAFTLIIYQNPENPHLIRNSVCKLLLSSSQIQIPIKLNISNDQSGRYPSWFCRKIEIEESKSLHQQTFDIKQWISENSLEVLSSNTIPSFKEKFQEHLSQLYIEWYQFNALWGCWQYEALNRFERSCIWISQFIISLCLVACYYGPTTMESYEMERELYYSLNFSVFEILYLAFFCYAVSGFVKFIFIKCLKN